MRCYKVRQMIFFKLHYDRVPMDFATQQNSAITAMNTPLPRGVNYAVLACSQAIKYAGEARRR